MFSGTSREGWVTKCLDTTSSKKLKALHCDFKETILISAILDGFNLNTKSFTLHIFFYQFCNINLSHYIFSFTNFVISSYQLNEGINFEVHF